MSNYPNNTKQKKYSLPLFLICDLLIAALLLCVFAYFHHVRPQKIGNNPSLIVPPVKTSVPTSQTDDPNSRYEKLEFYNKYKNVFTDGEIIQTPNSYRSPYISIYIREVRMKIIDCTYYVADVFIASLECLQSYIPVNESGEIVNKKGLDMFNESGAILSINGDYYAARDYGPVIRNYYIYREKKAINQDVCLLYYNGVMETMSGSEFSMSKAQKNGAYQCWAFGPALLDKNGEAITEFPSWYKNISGKNPRTAIGYYEPGHYCFVTIDGRTSESKGMTFAEEAALMESLGCTAAYNLDGGISSFMVFGNRYINVPPTSTYPDAPRAISDCIIIKEPKFE